MVSREEGFDEQFSDVAAAHLIQHAAAVSVASTRPAKRSLEKCWLARVGRHSALPASEATSRVWSRSDHSIRTLVGPASKVNDMTAAFTCSSVGVSGWGSASVRAAGTPPS